MKGPPLGTGGEDITWSDHMAPRGRKAPSTRKIKPQNPKPYAGSAAVLWLHACVSCVRLYILYSTSFLFSSFGKQKQTKQEKQSGHNTTTLHKTEQEG